MIQHGFIKFVEVFPFAFWTIFTYYAEGPRSSEVSNKKYGRYLREKHDSKISNTIHLFYYIIFAGL